MRDVARRILYVGKAKNLRNRIRSYFQKSEALSPKTKVLVKKIASVEFTVTNTELEALLLECNLIKKHRPRYNVRLKDDKNYPYVVLDFTKAFPQFRITRKVTTSPCLKYFGPYSTGVRNISRFLLKTFQIRDCSESKFKNRSRPCLNYEIKTCTAPCVGYVTEEDYAKQIREASLFLNGKKQLLVKTLKTEMSESSEKTNYEHAAIVRDKIVAIERITEKQNAILTEQRKNIDVVGYFEMENEIQWAILFVRNGFLVGRHTEKIKRVVETSDEAKVSFLEQFYTQGLLPDEVWVSEEFEGRKTLESLLAQKAKRAFKLQVKRGESPLRLLGMAQENAKLIYLDGKNKTKESASVELQNVFSLPDPPQTIEAIDVSNFQGTNPAVALVHFADERPLKSRYRLYYPKSITGQDDFGMIYETVMRRFSKLEDNPPPDLLLIDGGKGQLSSAKRALDELGFHIPLVSIAKARTESGFTLKKVERSEERLFIPGRKNPIILREGHPALMLLQQLRDEAHRFSIKSHRARREKETLQASELTDIAGIGPKKREKLLKHFGSMEALKLATLDELIESGLDQKTALTVLDSWDEPDSTE